MFQTKFIQIQWFIHQLVANQSLCLKKCLHVTFSLNELWTYYFASGQDIHSCCIIKSAIVDQFHKATTLINSTSHLVLQYFILSFDLRMTIDHSWTDIPRARKKIRFPFLAALRIKPKYKHVRHRTMKAKAQGALSFMWRTGSKKKKERQQKKAIISEQTLCSRSTIRPCNYQTRLVGPA